MNIGDNNSWLSKPSTIKKLWIGFVVVLVLTVVAQFFVKVKGYFGVDDWFAFPAIFGFVSCLIMVIFAKLLGAFLKRDERYYDEGDTDV